jgi:membrane-associated protease RseP (regulator of RpoE activity)
MRPTVRAWVRHSVLFLLTLLTTTLGGVVFLHESSLKLNIPEPKTWTGLITYIPEFYVKFVGLAIKTALVQPAFLADGLMFSLSLLAILTAHEAGHYVACRIYGVDATLPFFIPSPPLVGPGTFGAFIKIVSPIWSRRALFDIGVAGPIAGFIVVIPVSIIGLLTAQPAPPISVEEGVVILNDPLLIRIIAYALNVNLNFSAANPFYFAAWFGLIVTSLNLIPVGQLDGAHAVFAVFGATVHKWLGRIAFAIIVTLALLGYFWHGSPSGFLYAILLAVMLQVRHPQPEDMRPLDHKRLIIAFITLLVFALSFWPFPVAFR